MKELISCAKLVKSPERTSSLGVWTDYCELQCLVDEHYQIDRDQLGSIILKSEDFSKAIEGSQGKRKERLTTLLQDVYSHVALRGKMLPNIYPFVINGDDQLVLKAGTLTDLNKLYIFLLCASNLEYMQTIHNLTSDFEVVCLMYMRKLFPTMVFKLFGSSNTNTTLKADDVMKDVKLSDRIVNLANFITMSLDPDCLNKLSKYNHGDGGLDIVGIRPMGDERKSIPIIFGQCSCSYDEWSSKQQSISDDKWKKFLRTWESSIQTYIFIPIWNMNSEKQFEDDLKLCRCVLVDRQRILYLADDRFVNSLTLYKQLTK